eukprot:5896513-Amphidinium_carterae.1
MEIGWFKLFGLLIEQRMIAATPIRVLNVAAGIAKFLQIDTNSGECFCNGIDGGETLGFTKSEVTSRLQEHVCSILGEANFKSVSAKQA